MMQDIDRVLKFWFGRVEETIVPSERRARIWFSEDLETDRMINEQFREDLEKAVDGRYASWESNPRGQLALILLLDQFARHIYRNEAKAYAYDEQALAVCIKGLRQEADHALSLIERVFYYFPLLHAEKVNHQEQAIHAYQVLRELAFSETRVIYDSFLKFANHHHTTIQRFGRFPQRNSVLNRRSTAEEITYLQEVENSAE